MHGEVADALSKVEHDAGVRVLLITGAGRGFCAGQDLSDRAVAPGGDGVDLGESLETSYNPLIRRLIDLPKPVVCAVNGVAAGAGANIALACDIVLAAKSAKFIQSLLQYRPRARFRRHLDPAAARRPGARAGPGADRRTAQRRAGRRLGPDLARRRRRAS